MPSHPATGLPRAVSVIVRLVAAGTVDGHADIELWTPAGKVPTPRSAANTDLALVLRQASTLSDELGLHRDYDFVDQADDIAACVRSGGEKRAALDELRAQRTLLEPEASMGLHRADGSRKTERDRATALAMLLRLSVIRASILRRGFTIAAGAETAARVGA
jgi:hypothetical protein